MKNTLLFILIYAGTLSLYAQVPARPGAFLNPVTTVCKGTTGVSYTVNAPVSGAAPTSYEWSLIGGDNLGTINGASSFPVNATSPDGGRTVTVNFGNPEYIEDITLSVRAKNANGAGLPREISIHLNPIPGLPVLNSPMINEGNLGTLTASGCVGAVNWYKAATVSQANLLAANTSTFVTPVLYENTFYYANCTSTSGCVGSLQKTMVHVVPGKSEWAVSTMHPPGEVPGRSTAAEGKIIKMDAAGNSYIAGTIVNSFDYTHNGVTATVVSAHPGDGGNELFVMKLSPTGAFLWAKSFGMQTSFDGIIDLDITTDGFVYVSSVHPAPGEGTPSNFKYDGTSYPNVHWRGGTLLKVNSSSGALVWVKNQNENNSGFITGPRSGESEMNATRLFAIDHQVPAAQDFNQPRLFASLLATLNADAGNVMLNSQKEWALDGGWFGTNGNIPTLRWFKQIKLINNGNSMIVTGAAGANYDIVFICRIDNINTATPTMAWAKMPNVNVFSGGQLDITADNNGNIYAIGSKVFDSNSPTTTFTFAGEDFNLGYNYNSGFILKYDTNGNEIWALRLFAPSFSSGTGFESIISDGTDVYVVSRIQYFPDYVRYLSLGNKIGGTYTLWLAKVKPDKTCEWMYDTFAEGGSNLIISANENSMMMTGNANVQLSPDLTIPLSGPFNGMSVVKFLPQNNSCKPAQPGNFTQSTANLCKGQVNVPFTVPNVAGVNYKWIYRGTGISLNTTTTNSITLNVSGTATSDTLYCVPSNSCGAGPVRKIFLNINQNTPTAVLSAASDVNFIPNGKVSLNVNFTGTAPWTVTLSDGSSYQASANFLRIDKTGVNAGTLFKITSITDAACPAGLLSGEVYVAPPRCLDKALLLADGATRNVDGYQYNGDKVYSSGVAGIHSEMTVEMWLYPFVAQQYTTFFGCAGLRLGISNGFLLVGGNELTNVPIENKKWTHVAIATVPSSNKIMVYKNGVLVTEIPAGTYNFNGAEFTVGNFGVETYFKGMIDEFRIFNYSWTADDIRNFMNGNIADYEYDLKVYYDFNRTGTGPGLSVTNQATNGASGNGTTGGPTVTFQDICAIPAQPASVAAVPTAFCKNSSAYFYVPESNLTTYAWYYSGTGAVLKSNRNTMMLELGPNATSGTVSVYAVNPGNTSLSRTFVVTVGNCQQSFCHKNIVKFDGNSQIAVGPIEASPIPQRSITFWMKPNSYSDGTTKRGIFTSSTGEGAWLNFNSNGNLEFNSVFSWWNNNYPTGIPFSNEWQFIAICTYGSNVYMYRNGELKYTTTDGINLSGGMGDLRIGWAPGAVGFDGEMDGFAVWDKLLTVNEVLNLYQSRYISGLEYGISAYYHFDSGMGQGNGVSVPNNAIATTGSYNGTTAGSSNFPAFISAPNENFLGNSGTVNGSITGQKTYTANQTLTAPPAGQTNIVATAANVIYQAGNSVLLQPGFQTQAGAVFKAQLGGCY